MSRTLTCITPIQSNLRLVWRKRVRAAITLMVVMGVQCTFISYAHKAITVLDSDEFPTQSWQLNVNGTYVYSPYLEQVYGVDVAHIESSKPKKAAAVQEEVPNDEYCYSERLGRYLKLGHRLCD
jgi:hypothetical protein